jgi:1,4-dihydroxy-2-naphthoyl-CoA hydrolase
MTLLEKIQSRPLPFAVLMGVSFVEALPERVTATLLVRDDLCTLGNAIHGGALMAFADTVGAAATIINLPEGALGTTTIESKTNFIGAPKPASRCTRWRRRSTAAGAPRCGRPGSRPPRASWWPW